MMGFHRGTEETQWLLWDNGQNEDDVIHACPPWRPPAHSSSTGPLDASLDLFQPGPLSGLNERAWPGCLELPLLASRLPACKCNLEETEAVSQQLLIKLTYHTAFNANVHSVSMGVGGVQTSRFTQSGLAGEEMQASDFAEA